MTQVASRVLYDEARACRVQLAFSPARSPPTALMLRYTWKLEVGHTLANLVSDQW